MDSYLALTLVKLLLGHEGRVSFRTLEGELGLTPDQIAIVRHELVAFGKLAREESGMGLVWTGEPAAASAPTSPGPAAPSETAAAGSAPPSPSSKAPAAADAERRQLTVMFCDLVGSTALSTHLDPEDLRDVITRFQDACRTAIARYDGFLARYMGDGMLVYFGYPRAHEDDADRAVRTGLDILASMADLNADVGTTHGVDLAVRIGVATGPVVVGDIIGEGAAEEAAVVGETPNLAARLQGVAAPDQLVIGPVVRRLLGDRFVLEDLGVHDLKGIAEPVPTWRVCGEVDADREHAPAPRDGGRAFVGRSEEVGLLLRAWESSREGRGQVVLVQGEAGIGKSRLLEAVRERVAGEDYLWVAVRCSPYHTNSTLYPLIEHLRRAVGWSPEDDDAGRLAKLEAALGAQSAPLAEIVPLIAELLRLPLPPDRYPPSTLDPRAKREATLDAVVGWLLDEAERQPVLQIWEDLHWADPSTLELLALYIDQSPTVAMLNVLTYRPEFVPPWTMRSHMTPITLNRMERPEVEALIGLQAHGKPVPAPVVEHIASRADGVPLYVEELTKTILESGFLREEDDRFTLEGSLADMAIPETLQDSLMARLDRVPGARELAQLGSVLGREFAYEMLRSLAALEEPVLRENLGQLVEDELLYQRGRVPRARFIFKHALIHDAAYQSLLRRTRQQYHRSVAELLEARFPETVDPHPELLAHHYTEAGDATRGAELWLRAGERARGLAANEEAIGHLTRGLAVVAELPDDEERRRLELGLQLSFGHASLVAKGHGAPEVESAYERARVLCAELGDVPERLPALFGLWRFYIVSRPLDQTLELAQQLLRLAADRPDAVHEVIGCYVTGFTRFTMGELAAGEADLERAIAAYEPVQRAADVYRAAQDPAEACMIYSAMSRWLLGFPDQARVRMHDAIAHGEALDDAVSVAHGLSFAIIISEMCGDDAETGRLAERDVELSTEKGFAAWVAVGRIGGAAIACRRGEAGAVDALRDSVAAFRELGLDVLAPFFLTVLARAYGDAGEIEAGLEVLDQAEAVVEGRFERWWEAEVHRLRGELLLARAPGDAAEAETLFRRALDVARGQGARSLELRAATSLGRLWQGRGETEPAAGLVGDALGAFTEGFDTADLAAARALLEGWENSLSAGGQQ